MPDDRNKTLILVWKCDLCFADNFRAMGGSVDVGRMIALVCRTCDAVKRETVWERNLIADRRRRPRAPAAPR